MEKGQLEKSSLLAIVGIFAIVVIGGIWAYYHANNALENKLTTKKYGGEQMVEKFTPDDNWELGELTTKEVFVENTGTAKLFVRVKLEENWARNNVDFITLNSKNGSGKFSNTHFITGRGQEDARDGTTTGDGSVVTKTLGSSKWVYSSVDGYWYYNETLQPVGEAGSKTELFLESITLADDTDMGLSEEVKYYTLMKTPPANDAISDNATNGWKEFKGSIPAGATYSRSVSEMKSGFAGYTDAQYSLVITYETYQATPEARMEAVSSTGGNWDGEKTPKLD